MQCMVDEYTINHNHECGWITFAKSFLTYSTPCRGSARWIHVTRGFTCGYSRLTGFTRFYLRWSPLGFLNVSNRRRLILLNGNFHRAFGGFQLLLGLFFEIETFCYFPFLLKFLSDQRQKYGSADFHSLKFRVSYTNCFSKQLLSKALHIDWYQGKTAYSLVQRKCRWTIA